MATPSEVAFLVEAVAPLCEPLHAAFEKASDLAESHFIEYDMTGTTYARERTDLTRAHGRRLLMKSKIGDWKVTKTTNGQLSLSGGTLSARIMHVGPAGMLPVAGTNAARVSYYCNPPANLFGVEGSRLLLPWTIDPETGEIVFRVVRPIGVWGYRERAKVDVDFILPPNSADLSSMQFVPDDNAIELPFGDGEETEDESATGW